MSFTTLALLGWVWYDKLNKVTEPVGCGKELLMTETFLIKSACILNPEREQEEIGDLLLKNGKIVAIGGNIDCEEAKVIHAEGLCAAPGLVDMHVHLRDPGQTHKETIETGCHAAAAGGVTSILAMPNTKPVTDSPEIVRDILERAQSADAHVYVAAAITKGLKSEELCDLQALRQAGAIALSDDGRPVTNTALLAQAMQQAPKIGMQVVAHCEDLFLAAGGLMNEGDISHKLGVKGIPAAAEDCGTAREIALAAAYQVPVHICHVSTATSAQLIRDAKRRGVQVTAETGPHYFMLTEDMVGKRDADYRMNPPLRTECDRQAMIEALRDGTIDVIATDHAPHSPQEKADFLTAPNGVIGLETSLAAGITQLVNPGVLTLIELIRKMSFIPAQILGIHAGTLRLGSPADIVLFDPKARWTVDPETLHGKSKNTPFKGMNLSGKVRFTFCGGKMVYCAK